MSRFREIGDNKSTLDAMIYANAANCEMAEGLERGHLSFRSHGKKLRGAQAAQSWQTA
jgi:hypothetical protein